MSAEFTLQARLRRASCEPVAARRRRVRLHCSGAVRRQDRARRAPAARGRDREGVRVSKPIAREALRQLTAAGLISTEQGKVARAKALNGETLERIYGYAVRSNLPRLREANEMRRVIETGIARLAAQRRDKAGMAAMEAPPRRNAGLGSEIRRPSPRPTSSFTSGSPWRPAIR